jgi:hypothetical protein
MMSPVNSCATAGEVWEDLYHLNWFLGVRIHQSEVSADYPIKLSGTIICNLDAKTISSYSSTTITIEDSC